MEGLRTRGLFLHFVCYKDFWTSTLPSTLNISHVWSCNLNIKILMEEFYKGRQDMLQSGDHIQRTFHGPRDHCDVHGTSKGREVAILRPYPFSNVTDSSVEAIWISNTKKYSHSHFSDHHDSMNTSHRSKGKRVIEPGASVSLRRKEQLS